MSRPGYTVLCGKLGGTWTLKSTKNSLLLTAPDECLPQMKKFKIKQIVNTIPGYKVDVCMGIY